MLPPKESLSLKKQNAIKLADCLAKTLNLPEKVIAGLTVEEHCKIVGKIAREIVKRMPGWLKEAFFPAGVSLTAAVHDVGKVSPHFQEKLRRNISEYVFNSMPGLEKAEPNFDKEYKGHATVSKAALKDIHEITAEIAGKHHGYSAVCSEADAEIYGGQEWQKRRKELIVNLKKYFNEPWPEINSDLQSETIAGLTCVSDWIGSGDTFLRVIENTDANIISSVNSAGFVKPQIKKNLSFKEIFSFSPHEAQVKLIQAANRRGVYTLEAPMGMGKTEAALFAAYQMLEKEQATGIYFALPTMLTSNKIWERMNNFLAVILDESSVHKKSLLVHSLAWLAAGNMGADAEPGQAWFNSGKRGILAPFAVGTLDQALMAVLNVKHNFVRTLGLMGKVVILDEIHSYDSYTGTILDELVTTLKQLKCTVIILSATLTGERKNKILAGNIADINEYKKMPYPLITSLPEGAQKAEEIPAGSSENNTVIIKTLNNHEQAIEEALLRAERNEQVLWIENTVSAAQDIFKILSSRASEMSIKCGLVHSRFIKKQREKNETLWVQLYGKEGKLQRKEQGRILIGTQVLEQSLDIDADFLITRLCPSDMLLQRMGRLWRHKDNDSLRPEKARRETWIIAPDYKKTLTEKDAFEESALVYAPYILLRTLEIWKEKKEAVIPGQIREIIENTYSERNDEGLAARYKQELENKRDELKGKALAGISKGLKTLPDNNTGTRYSEIDNTDVLLLKSIDYTDNEVILHFLDGSSLALPKARGKIKPSERRKYSAQIIMNTVSVSEKKAPDFIAKDKLLWLADYVYLGDDFDREHPFRIALVSAADEIMSIYNSEASGKYRLSYSNIKGYTALKKK